ncbi:GNAT family N-acetyltransferase [Microbacterium horticulturae]|uniref:GNAT family N-acetyltransferase n=1 Tax=Microbacterium horticulturae TaxID=3028316 RepID=A0ABY8BU76_9MICO|nr:GNAT family N-acetyltransferase [Microbacterium sp. KACC 23027]WEG07735.1 GNAT family N-acetyltransferase [Microbacterium sp. KACC 23027]
MASVQPLPVDDPISRGLLADYVAMRAASFPGQYTPASPPRAMFEPPAGIFLVVRDDEEQAVGCGGIRRLPDSGTGVRYEVKHLFLKPSTRGRGWGRMLLNELERHAREWGATELVLDTHHTLTAAGGLYASSGFVEIEPYNDNPNATRWYGKALGS